MVLAPHRGAKTRARAAEQVVKAPEPESTPDPENTTEQN
jgi:hypothetical protein